MTRDAEELGGTVHDATTSRVIVRRPLDRGTPANKLRHTRRKRRPRRVARHGGEQGNVPDLDRGADDPAWTAQAPRSPRLRRSRSAGGQGGDEPRRDEARDRAQPSCRSPTSRKGHPTQQARYARWGAPRGTCPTTRYHGATLRLKHGTFATSAGSRAQPSGIRKR